MFTPKPSYTYEELLTCGRGELFGPGNAQLPLPPMLMFDRITSIKKDGGSVGLGSVTAELDVKPDLWFFPCHFKGDPVMPGCLGLDALWQLLGFFLGWLGEPDSRAHRWSTLSSHISNARRKSAATKQRHRRKGRSTCIVRSRLNGAPPLPTISSVTPASLST